MPTKRKPTEQELKDRLWAMVQTLDFSDGATGMDDLQHHPDYEKWDIAMARRTPKSLKIAGFEASTADIGKILQEVEHSCLTDKCKKTLTKALKEAK